MTNIINALIAQWPSLIGLVAIGLVFWTLFKKYFEENKQLIEGLKALSNEQRNDLEKLFETHQSLSNKQRNDLEKLFETHQSLSKEQRASIDQVLERYRHLSEDQVAEIDRLRILVTSLVQENEKMGKRYDGTKLEFSKVALENRALKRAIEKIEEMMIATGSDVKVISTELRKTREDIDEVTKMLEHKPPK